MQAPAMREALRQLQSNDYRKADVLMISDFVMPSFDKQTQEQIQDSEERARPSFTVWSSGQARTKG
jgi:uncharacterized protein with von Willebrand factor type A (vWA) domain